ncbi:hypothetical protein NPA08_04440 [Mycoplasmopsis citelli]|uniref:Uncharacterized protein n=1 Tax=Mycoplasmopsis citelli TaxID=171281 RepID=A0A449B2A8_9BACT|nr:hypothetical protein [Mycoplasmopsis citelli]UUD36169.1 hypothetical protein NPA08_04440 [Mycoplasmopsis citelli]VEU74664.1 Uncharacterised protein [Mycoplasmopsis citelli]
MFQPKNSNDTVEMYSSNELQKHINEQEKIINKYQDPQQTLSPVTYKVIQKEKRILKITAIFWILIILATLASALSNYLINTRIEPSSGIFNWILIGIAFVLSVYMLFKKLIRIKDFKNIEKRYRENVVIGDIAASTVFADLYKSLSKRVVTYTWLYVFFMTFFALNLLFLFLLNRAGLWEFKTSPESSFRIEFTINFKKMFTSWFGNTNAVLIIGLVIVILITILYLYLNLYNRSRIFDVKSLIVHDSAQFITEADQAKKSLNKAWRNTYIIIFILVYVLPFALFLFLLWRGIIRRKK